MTAAVYTTEVALAGIAFVVLVAVDIVAVVVEVLLLDTLQDSPHHQVLYPGRYRKKAALRFLYILLSALQ